MVESREEAIRRAYRKHPRLGRILLGMDRDPEREAWRRKAEEFDRRHTLETAAAIRAGTLGESQLSEAAIEYYLSKAEAIESEDDAREEEASGETLEAIEAGAAQAGAQGEEAASQGGEAAAPAVNQPSLSPADPVGAPSNPAGTVTGPVVDEPGAGKAAMPGVGRRRRLNTEE